MIAATYFKFKAVSGRTHVTRDFGDSQHGIKYQGKAGFTRMLRLRLYDPSDKMHILVLKWSILMF